MKHIRIIAMFLLSTLIACATPTPTPIPLSPTPLPTATPVPPTATPAPTATPTRPPTPTPIPALPAEPRAIKFKAVDGSAGQNLDGLYYPAAVNPAPLVVLMHWAGADQADWAEVAFWLQNRGLGKRTPNARNLPWRDPAWFPAMLQGRSFAVFTFTYRGCDANGCRALNAKGWLEDSYAAMKTASEFEGVDSKRVIAAGASIGADGAADGCAWLNAQKGKGLCLGAMPFSPGNYLTIPYPAAASPLQNEQPPKPVWCLAAEGDRESAPTCASAQGTAYRNLVFGGNGHGMELIGANIKPKGVDANALQLMLEFIKLTFGQ